MKIDDLRNILVGEVMTKELFTVRENDNLATVDKIFSENRINHIPVINQDSELKGMLTKNDILLMKDWATPHRTSSSAKSNEILLRTNLAKERMHSNLVTVTPDDTLSDCAKVLDENLFHALPVIEGSKIVGIISSYDLIKVAFIR